MANGGTDVKQGPKILLEKVPHLKSFLPDLRSYPNPLYQNSYFHPVPGFFVTDREAIAQNIVMDVDKPVDQNQRYFARAGPRERVFFEGEEVKVAIVTCGGLCPGMNTVIRELVNGLWYQYHVRDIRGIQAGYRGFFSSEHVPLTPKVVDHWHKQGGTRLGTSRGGFDLQKIVNAIQDRGYNIVFLIGGDGTLRGAVEIFNEIKKRSLKVSIACIPKTVDNDVGIIDRSFGLQTAVEVAQEAISAAHVEAESTPNGVGLVKVMGRYAGHIAVNATLSSRDVDCCLIPEIKFFTQGRGGLFEFMEQRLMDNGHCVIVMAEGAGQDLLDENLKESTKDESGNVLLRDIGLWLSSEFKKWFKEKHPDKLFAVKYIDPTYMVRAVPSNATDTLYCTILAHSAIHGAMAGYTGFVAGPVNGNYCYIPLELVAVTRNPVDVNNPSWAWVRSVNNQPDFVPPGDDRHKAQEKAVQANLTH
ncbi:hypothetical protein SELMODRAFT_438337 [Selaginella moellendorffii]|uniref:ATP-dependent 6-phosphofructokinase n=1 Tax=Selaginella moellendorffii TaxID=88036 RepID=D8QW81_SELML|nr:ATP-dependent 6-phosphofructokinase 2-like [Selaginella moellendorffii]XP_024544208.1 ATP-dependent 6-phosphofructokinase 2-like [Selaginella moellendorffii]EFJ36587.1 hypothetical protein SELMODRAFT_438337 [Selaginella moellendorffii]|eukprot:XP_024544200.1 ATP-dependent 6-phosphofructokinase 2-like [Selaginella moellendorffii]